MRSAVQKNVNIWNWKGFVLLGFQFTTRRTTLDHWPFLLTGVSVCPCRWATGGTLNQKSGKVFWRLLSGGSHRPARLPGADCGRAGDWSIRRGSHTASALLARPPHTQPRSPLERPSEGTSFHSGALQNWNYGNRNGGRYAVSCKQEDSNTWPRP